MRTWRSQKGQAFTETLLVSWLLFIFIAAMWQLFIVNDTIFRSLAAVHSLLFADGYGRNQDTTGYSRDAVVVVWDRPRLPEAEIPVINMFKAAVGRTSIKLRSNVQADRRKRTFMGSGTAGPSNAGGGFAGLADYFFTHPFEMGQELVRNPGEYGSAYYQRLGY